MANDPFFRLQRRRAIYWRYVDGIDEKGRLKETDKAHARTFDQPNDADAEAELIYRRYGRTYRRYPQDPQPHP